MPIAINLDNEMFNNKSLSAQTMNKSNGFTLIEVLISLVVLSLGLLGLAALQASSLRSNQGAYYRSQAAQFAYNIADRMRANVVEASKGATSKYITTDVDDAVAQELSAKAALQGAKADLIKSQFDLDNTLITAPISGLIERSRYYEGRLVSAQTDLLTVVHRVDPMFVVVNVPESFILKRRRDIESKKIHHPGVYQLRGRLTMMDDTAYPHEGVLDLLEPGLRTETGSRQTRITFPNPDRSLLPGQFVKVRFTGDTKTDAVLIPQRAVLQGPQGPFVYVVGPDEKVQIRDVVASTWKGDQWMIDGGLKAGDRVVVNGLMTIGPGAPVKAVPWKSTAVPETDPVPPTPKQG